MSMARSTEEKVKLIIKTFLCANKGKKYTSGEIAHFINTNNLSLPGKFNITNVMVTRLIKADYPAKMLGDVKMDRRSGATNNVWNFWI